MADPAGCVPRLANAIALRQVCKAVGEDQTDFYYVMHAEPGGSIPNWIASKAVPGSMIDLIRFFIKVAQGKLKA